jgi:hypothetical protein
LLFLLRISTHISAHTHKRKREDFSHSLSLIYDEFLSPREQPFEDSKSWKHYSLSSFSPFLLLQTNLLSAAILALCAELCFINWMPLPCLLLSLVVDDDGDVVGRKDFYVNLYWNLFRPWYLQSLLAFLVWDSSHWVLTFIIKNNFMYIHCWEIENCFEISTIYIVFLSHFDHSFFRMLDCRQEKKNKCLLMFYERHHS